ncbi:putative lipid II flippase FtsW [Ornithinimicrobium avium]|uniref:Probable peptidoglycan glycosyltransferase FtsW n=1 Tax=Ornithinimicrobium avium TaxID=2283195 RepID=A0A345NKV1_9MICO|nr:putative lipid II flippase FtsW [Ornithinimicrobium avium]AXH95659.1 putative lipid II flippase FtsW [Ornithinimicrobium avium]
MTSLTRDGRGAAATRGGAQEWTVASVGEWLRSPVAPYYLVLVSATVLTGLGLVMVLSASSVGSYATSGSSYTVFLDQLLYASLGIGLAVVASRLPVSWWKKLAWPAIFVALLLQALVFTSLGVGEFQGNNNWISIGGRTIQPSEFGKIALVVFGAAVLATKRRVIHRIGHATVPLVFPFGIVLVGLVLQGHDLGTAMIMLAILVGMLWAAGLPAKWFLGVGAVAVAGVAFLAAGSANRMQRIQVWIGGICDNPHAATGCFQKVHAEWALADGGWWGLGLGESREKWGLLPEPHNDFILAIIGEELGLGGTVAVLALFAVLAYACYRIVSQAEDTFVRLAASGVMIWLLTQAMLNIGSVIGMLPIIGVPLPLVSSGGSALVAALIGVGLLLSLARAVPGARERLSPRTSRLSRTLAALPTRRTTVAGTRGTRKRSGSTHSATKPGSSRRTAPPPTSRAARGRRGASPARSRGPQGRTGRRGR